VPRPGRPGDPATGGAAHFAAALGVLILLIVGLPPAFPALPVVPSPLPGLAVFLLLGVAAWRWLPEHGQVGRFGTANRITLGRLVGAACLAGFVGQGEALREVGGWPVFTVIAALLALDGVDGWAARRGGTASPFGARFDMEVDAALLLVLSVLTWEAGLAGAWVLGIGLFRYGFVAAGAVWPWLRGSLPASRRRKAVCVLQGVALGAAWCPASLPPLIPPALLLSLTALAASFAMDVALLRRRRPVPRRRGRSVTAWYGPGP